ncbi:DUF2752 domain-containing protein [Butyricicoccus sp.]|uniref:DUF2752 domain-containing protein n=1 Tax=Butyricicoccus sp. TaxID=2049021 RepID=UPI003F163B4A
MIPFRMHAKKFLEMLLLCIAFLQIGLLIGCPIKNLTGIPCLTCGMSRAWKCILLFQFREAVGYHPLFWLAPYIVGLIFGGDWIKQHCRYHWMYPVQIAAVIALLIGVYLYRVVLIPTGPVTICLQDGWMYHSVQMVMQYLNR